MFCMNGYYCDSVKLIEWSNTKYAFYEQTELYPFEPRIVKRIKNKLVKCQRIIDLYLVSFHYTNYF